MQINKMIKLNEILTNNYYYNNSSICFNYEYYKSQNRTIWNFKIKYIYY